MLLSDIGMPDVNGYSLIRKDSGAYRPSREVGRPPSPSQRTPARRTASAHSPPVSRRTSPNQSIQTSSRRSSRTSQASRSTPRASGECRWEEGCVVTALDRPLRFLLVDAGGDEAATLASVQAAVPPSSDVERTATMTEALERLDGEPPVDVVLLDPDVPDRTVVEAFAAAHARAPDVPVVVLTRVEGDYLALAIAAVTRSPQSAAAGARRIAALLPRYLEHREADVTALRDALECEDYEAVARSGTTYEATVSASVSRAESDRRTDRGRGAAPRRTRTDRSLARLPGRCPGTWTSRRRCLSPTGLRHAGPRDVAGRRPRRKGVAQEGARSVSARLASRSWLRAVCSCCRTDSTSRVRSLKSADRAASARPVACSIVSSRLPWSSAVD